MKKLKTFLSVALVSLFIFSFVVSAHAITWLHPIHHSVITGTRVSGGTYDLRTDNEVTLNILAQKTGIFLYTYRLLVEISMENHQYDKIKVDFTDNHDWMVKIRVLYTDDTNTLLAQGLDGTYELFINEAKYLEAIELEFFGQIWWQQPNKYLYIDLVLARLAN
ncbi:hypothetical protein LCGC14_2139820 [marine sediment metagenome]|uniref:Uncharacterized protein n=1 Tax=marine sediment metagenome TaxID=412755 RepID=A0A0F9DYN6_9ZZZZ